jgi:hypothetical protein
MPICAATGASCRPASANHKCWFPHAETNTQYETSSHTQKGLATEGHTVTTSTTNDVFKPLRYLEGYRQATAVAVKAAIVSACNTRGHTRALQAGPAPQCVHWHAGILPGT